MDVRNGLLCFLWREICLSAGDPKVPLSCTASESPVSEFHLTEAKQLTLHSSHLLLIGLMAEDDSR